MAFDEAPRFLSAIQEIPSEAMFKGDPQSEIRGQPRSWVMKAARGNGTRSQTTVRSWASNGWTNFLDLLKVCGFLRVFRVLGTHGSRTQKRWI